MIFNVYHGGTLVGRVRAASVYEADTEVAVVERFADIRPADTVRAVFTLDKKT